MQVGGGSRVQCTNAANAHNRGHCYHVAETRNGFKRSPFYYSQAIHWATHPYVPSASLLETMCDPAPRQETQTQRHPRKSPAP